MWISTPLSFNFSLSYHQNSFIQSSINWGLLSSRNGSTDVSDSISNILMIISFNYCLWRSNSLSMHINAYLHSHQFTLFPILEQMKQLHRIIISREFKRFRRKKRKHDYWRRLDTFFLRFLGKSIHIHLSGSLVSCLFVYVSLHANHRVYTYSKILNIFNLASCHPST